jgi:glyoxylase-like metal-dependent hydrolase (beta-lactamase superfamily II)
VGFNVPEVKGEVIFESFPVGPLQCNCAIIGDPVTKKCLIVDPGGDPDRIMAVVEANGLTVTGIIHTHAHLDHILASAEIRQRTGAPLLLHQGDKFLWNSLEEQCAKFGLEYTDTPDPDSWLKDEELLDCCGGVAIHTPGHTPGSISFWFEDHELLVAGDTLFQMGIGRTDLPGGSFNEIEKSITERLFKLADDALVITGHGPATSLAFEKQANPFFGGIS